MNTNKGYYIISYLHIYFCSLETWEFIIITVIIVDL